MKKVTITIDTTNAAFEDESRPSVEVARILRELSTKFDNGVIPQKIYDANGNAVGTCKVK